LNNLDSVNQNVVELFREAAKKLISKCDGDAEKALCTALAYISGHYKAAMTNRSLLTGQEKQITIELRSLGGKWPNPTSNALAILRKYWPGKMVDSIKGKID